MSSPISASQDRLPVVVVWLATIGVAVAAIVVLHEIGAAAADAIDWSDPWGWVGAHSAERVVMALGRLVALALAYWIAASAALYPLAKTTRMPALIRSVEWLTLPAVRRLADRTLVVSLAVSSLAPVGGTGAALAFDSPAQDADPSQPVQVHQPEAHAVVHYVPVPAGDAPMLPAPTVEDTDEDSDYAPTPAGSETIPMPISPPGTAAVDPWPVRDPSAADVADQVGAVSATVETDYTIVPGDNLWLVAERHLATVLDRIPAEHEIATYWAHLIGANRPRLRSGNPDLIYPGEAVTCPATNEVGLTK